MKKLLVALFALPLLTGCWGKKEETSSQNVSTEAPATSDNDNSSMKSDQVSDMLKEVGDSEEDDDVMNPGDEK